MLTKLFSGIRRRIMYLYEWRIVDLSFDRNLRCTLGIYIVMRFKRTNTTYSCFNAILNTISYLFLVDD